ncbi:MAG TPA: DnaJ domain-containing protein [Thermoanaerobaculia bacterium]|nr:DnaJ domain-containing protein [Thermoanaerobaculia bacterium]
MEVHRELTDEEYRLFSERIARGLAEHPLKVLPQEHREQVAELLKQLGDVTFYHLLGIDPGSGAREVHDAYDRVARLVHPSHAKKVGLEGREEVLRLLFERVTRAYLTLSDIERRKVYDRDVGPVRWTALRTSRASKEEEALRCYEKARALSEAEDYHYAIELLRRSVSLSPRADAYGLLGILLAKNPQWLDSAVESLERAQEMGATEPGLGEALKEVREKIGKRD